MFGNKHLIKSISALLLTILTVEMATPIVLQAGIASQPEFSANSSGFSEMVDPFTGQFHYSLPLMEVPGAHGAGYSVVLNYAAGSGPDADASWVGYGWSLNSGSIVRNKRGFADDMYNEKVDYYNKTRPITTWAVGPTFGANIEVFDGKIIGLGANAYLRYNSVKGYSTSMGVWGSALGIASIGLNVDSQEGATASYSVNLSPASLVSLYAQFAGKSEYGGEKKLEGCMAAMPALMSISGQIGGSEPPRPTSIQPMESTGMAASLSVQGIIFVSIGGDPGLYGMYQKMKTIEHAPRYDYGYMYSAPLINNRTKDNTKNDDFSVSFENDKALMDYSTEGEAPYDVKKTKRLHAPFATYDNFIVSAQGVGGTFRLHNKGVVQYRPGYVNNSTTFVNASLQAMIPFTPASPSQTWSISGSADPATTTLKTERSSYFNKYTRITGDWYTDADRYKEKDRNCFARFHNDLGGKVLFAAIDAPVMLPNNSLPDTNYFHRVNRGRTPGSSNFVGYHTYDEITTGSTYRYDHGTIFNDIFYNSLTLTDVKERTRRQNLIQKQIAEYSVVNSNGNRYTFGLPVYARNEVTMNYNATPPSGSTSSKTAITSKEASPENLSNVEVAIGEKHTDPYITSHLLTEITTPDYVDRTGDGPTKDDFGGWVKFNYTRRFGTENKYHSDSWFKWRSPYFGLRYSMNNIDDNEDDMGSVSYGEREVYVLESIETATHLAKFTVDNTHRLDAQGAIINDAMIAKTFPEATVSPVPNPTPVYSSMLQQIDLYAYRGDGTVDPGNQLPIKSVHFAYDYSAWQGTWDNTNTLSDPTGGKAGKLTLKKVWFESMGAKNATIAPYEFFYAYQGRQSDFTKYYGSAGSGIESYINESATLPTLFETPEYDPGCVDRWGAYRDVKHTHLPFQTHPWVDQNPNVSITGDDAGKNFDPAAWQLKMIKLPSGGEIHIEYEQNDYQYVQDRRAMKMMKVVPDGSSNHIFTISNAELFGTYAPSATTAMRTAAVNLITNQLIGDNKERVYFKFLYSLWGASCSSFQYIRGYTKVTAVEDVSAAGIKITIQDPVQAAIDYRQSMDKSSGNHPECFGSTGSKKPSMSDPKGGFKTLLGSAATEINRMDDLSHYTTLPAITTSTGYNDASYLRLPLTVPKKGGGIRVHRIISVSSDNLLETNRSKVNGVEYLYETLDDNKYYISSGVATNEPSIGEDENALVRITEDPIPDFPSNNDDNTVIAGENIQYFEGPLGMQLLPGASVGYSRIITRNIFTTGNVSGFQVSDFYTAQNFPSVKIEKTKLDIPYSTVKSPISFNITNPSSHDGVSMQQGYTFHVSSMHGSARGVSSYGGEYILGTMGIHADSDQFSGSPSASTTYKYFADEAKKEVNDAVPVMYDVDRPLRMEPMGKEMETFFETRLIREDLENVPIHASGGMNFGFAIPFPVISAWAYYMETVNEINMLITNKVITRPVLLESVETRTADGIAHLSKNIAFDPTSGNPAIVQTSDSYDNSSGHKGLYTVYSTPAANVYKSMGQIATSEGLTIVPMKTFSDINVGTVATPIVGGTSKSISFSIANSGSFSGDMYNVNRDNYKGVLKELSSVFSVNDIIEIRTPAGIFMGTGRITGASLNLTSGTLSCGFDQIDGTPIGNYPQVIVEILRSGKTNQLNDIAENVTVYGDSKTDEAVAYAKKLAEKELKATELNNWAYIQSFTGSPLQRREIRYEKLTYNPAANYLGACTFPTNIRNHQFNYEFDALDYFWTYCPGSPEGTACTEDYLGGPIQPGANNRYFEVEIQPGLRDLRIGWTTNGSTTPDTKWNFSSTSEYDPILISGTPDPIEDVYQDFPYSGIDQELFQINDDGQLSFYHYLTSETSDRNVAFVQRNHPYASGRSNYVMVNLPCNSCSPASTIVANPHIESCYSPATALPDNMKSSVVSATAQTFYYPQNVVPAPRAGHPWSKFVYDAKSGGASPTALAGKTTSILDGSYPTVSETGIAPGSYTRFNYTGPATTNFVTDNPTWKLENESEIFSNNGEPIQTKDDLEVNSSVSYTSMYNNDPDYARMIPSISAWNAKVDELYFESYENHLSTVYLPPTATSATAHTGDNCLQIAASGSSALAPAFTFPRSGSYLIQFWFAYEDNSVTSTLPTVTQSPSTPLTNTSVIRTGSWQLFTTVTSGDPTGQSITIGNASSTAKLLIDDFKIQPYEAKATCTVFDRYLRPRAVFDDNHFAMITQYSGEGVPIRTVRETERGFFTVADQHANLPLSERPSLTYNILPSPPPSSGMHGGSGGETPLPVMMRAAKPVIPMNSPANMPEEEEEGEWNAKFDVIDLKLSPDKQKLKIFGVDSVDKLLDTKKLKDKYKQLQLPSTDSLNLKKKINELKPDYGTLRKIPDSIKNLRTKTLQKP